MKFRKIINLLVSSCLAMGLTPITTSVIGGVTVFLGFSVGTQSASANSTTCSEFYGTWKCTGPNGTQTCSEFYGTLRCSGPGGTTTCSEFYGTWKCTGSSSGTTTCSEFYGTIRCNGPDGTTTCSEFYGTMKCTGPGGTTTCSEFYGTYRCTGSGGNVLPIPSSVKPSATPTPINTSKASPTPSANSWGNPGDSYTTKQICTSSKNIEENCTDFPDLVYEVCVNSQSGMLQQKLNGVWKNLWKVTTEKNSEFCDSEFSNLLTINATSKGAKGTLFFRIKFNKTAKVGAWNLDFKAKVVG
jgi:hypothetical protein